MVGVFRFRAPLKLVNISQNNVLNRLFAIWCLIFMLALAPITIIETDSLGIQNPVFETSGRDDDEDEYCEQYEDDPSGCHADSACEWDDDECEEYEVDDYCEDTYNDESSC